MSTEIIMNFRTMIQTRIDDCREILEENGLPMIPIAFVIETIDKKNVAGRAHYPSLITISKEYLEQPENTTEVIKQTVAHEIAHLYVYRYYRYSKQAHGPEFRKVMQMLGLQGRTYHNMKMKGSEIKQKQIKRYIYLTEITKREIGLTSGQHKRQCECLHSVGESRYSSKGEKLTYASRYKIYIGSKCIGTKHEL